MKDGTLVGDDADFEVKDGGLLGTAFNHGTLFVEGGALGAVSRRSMRRLHGSASSSSSSPWVEGPAIDSWVEASVPALFEARSHLACRRL